MNASQIKIDKIRALSLIFIAFLTVSLNAEAQNEEHSAYWLDDPSFSSAGIFNAGFWLMIGMQSPYTEDYFNDDTSNYRGLRILHPPPLNPYDPDYGRYKYGSKRKPMGYKSTVRFDSTGNKLVRDDSVMIFDVGHSYPLTIEEYADRRKKQIQKHLWDSLTADYDLKQALSEGDLARLLGAATGMTIPVPPNPVIGLFGKPEISINVSGEINLRIGWRWDTQNLGTVSAFGQSQSSPIFSQDIRVNVSGGIGDKLKLTTDWNTRRQFEHENKFKIGYEGYDDDIVRLVEVGNVSLPLTTSLIRGGESLFGVRADFQFGPLFLKTLVSQRRSQRKFVNAQGGVSRTPFQLRAYDYAKNHFFLDTAYKTVYRDYFSSSTPVIPKSASKVRIKEIQVWESAKDIVQQDASPGVAFANLETRQVLNESLPQSLRFYPDSMKRATIQTGYVERGRFRLLDSSAFYYDINLGTLTIFNLRQDRTYAVSYRIEGETTEKFDDEYYGYTTNVVGERDTLILKLVYVQNLQPTFKTLWDRQMKNVYSINATNVNLDETEIGVWYIRESNDSADVLEGAPDKLVTILGVDQVNNSTGQPPGDGQFDTRHPFFDARRGLITFPSPEPFRQGLRDYFENQGTPQFAEKYIFPEVYDTTYDVARLNTARDRFVISGYVSGRASNRIALGAFNLAPGSVKVTLDGMELREYQDYTIDYYTGVLILKNPRATLPNANLKIEYEAQDIFNLTTRTLVGLRGDYILYNSRRLNSIVGFTFMHYDESALIDRVRIGEEPVSNAMFGIDGKLDWDTPWLTEALDKLPFYDTKAESHINLSGELALTMPEPNKRRSEVASDNGEPVVYIDDFEGAQRYIPLGLSATQWSHSSQPVDLEIGATSRERSLYRGRTVWYQYFIPWLSIQQVWPNRDVLPGNNNISPLIINFNRTYRGIYNKNPNFLDENNPNFDQQNAWSEQPQNKEKIWGGMMRLLSSFNTNFDTENIEYIEIMMNHTAELGARMFVDLGQISEDIIPDSTLNTEDGITNAAPVPNGIIDSGEDKGIDALNDAQEKEEYPFPLNLEDDPARDNYAFNFSKPDQDREFEDFLKYNNFEGNALVSETGQFPDTEILNPNNGLELMTANDYFSYEINLLKDPLFNPQIVGGNPDAGWYLYRIPIRQPHYRVGNPSFSNVQYLRIWFKGASINALIADWRLVGTQWQRISNFQPNVGPNDSVLTLAFVNRYENSGPPDYYTMPPGVKPPRERNADPTKDIRLNEQSLSVSVKNLKYGEERMTVRIFPPQDIFYYKKMKFFVHGDGTMPDNIVEGAIPKAYAFIRFGTDSSNYYEYRRPLTHGWQDVEIKLEELTAIKQRRDSLQQYQRMEYGVGAGDPYGIFAVKGNPTLTRVQFYGFGIANPSQNAADELTTTMWINELRLISPEASSDWAGVGSLDMKLADLGNINASINHSEPNFHQLEERFGNRETETNWTVNMQGNLEKFAPKAFKQMKLPITYTHAEFLRDPKFVANNDVKLEEAARQEYIKAKNDNLSDADAAKKADSVRRYSQTLRIQDSWALTGVKLGIPVNHWSVDETFNKLTLGYSYSQEFERSPVVEQRFRWMWRLNAQYANTIPEFLVVRPLGWAEEIPVLGPYNELKINFLPSNVNAGLNMLRSRTTEKSRFLSYPSPVIRDFRAERHIDFSWSIAQGGFINPVFDYALDMGSTLVPFELDENGLQRTGSEIADAIFFKDGLMDFGKDNTLNQSVTLNFKPRLPFKGVDKFLDMSGTFRTDYNWTNPLQPDPEIHDKAKQVQYQNDIKFNIGFKLKSLADSWWGDNYRNRPGRPPSPDSAGSGIISSIGRAIKFIFLDFEKVEFIFNHRKSSLNPGVLGGNGLTNFWARGFTGRSSENLWGPSFPYQLGLISNPHGGFNMVPSSSFPYFGFDTYVGLRPPDAILQDVFDERSTLEMRTSRPLWEGATLNLSWRSELGYNRNQTVLTDENGVPEFSNITALHSLNKTFLSFPSIFGINVFNTDIDNVIRLYEIDKADILASSMDTVQKNQALQNALAKSFREGLNALSFIGGEAGRFLPQLNWNIRWEGIEKWGIWDKLLKRATIDHVYTGTYQETAKTTDIGTNIENQQVQWGFQPLIGVSVDFDDKKIDGTLNGTVRWNVTKSYSLISSARSRIQANASNEIMVNASYTMNQFEFPLLGFNLENDFEISFMGTYKHNNRATYDVLGANDEDGQRLDGNTQIIVEPRARYSLSDRVTASFFFRYEGTFPEGASRSGFNTFQVGLDIRISIAGGR